MFKRQKTTLKMYPPKATTSKKIYVSHGLRIDSQPFFLKKESHFPPIRPGNDWKIAPLSYLPDLLYREINPFNQSTRVAGQKKCTTLLSCVATVD